MALIPVKSPITARVPRSDVPVNAKTDYGAVGDGTTDDTTALQNFITYVITNNKRGYIPAGVYKITAALNFTYRPYWTIEGAGRGLTTIKQFTDNTAIFNLGSDSASFMHTFKLSGFTLDYANSQPAANTNANPIQYNKMVFEGIISEIVFAKGSYGDRIATASDAPWGMTYDNLQFTSGLTAGAMDWSLGTAATPNNKFGRFEIDCQNMVGPVMAIRGYNFVIDTLEFLSANNSPRLLTFAAGGQVEIGTLKCEIGSYTSAQSLFYFDVNAHANIGHISIGGTTFVANPSSGTVQVLNAQAGASVVVGDITAQATTAANAYIASSSGNVKIGRLRAGSSTWPASPGWALQDNASSSSGDNITVEAWVKGRLSGNKGDADYTVTAGDPNVVSFQTAFTAQRTITLPVDGPNMHNGLYYELVFDGAINGANTALIKAGAGTTLMTLTSDKTIVRYTWRRHATAASGWVLTKYEIRGDSSALARTPDVQVFTSSGTWTKPAGVSTVRVVAIGGGGGGGSGRRGAAGSVRSGGGGGGGGAREFREIPAAALPGTVSVTVNTASSGGAAASTDDTGGSGGGTNGGVLFGLYCKAVGGSGGGAGGTGAASGGGGASGSFSGGTGAGSSGTGAAGSQSATTANGPSGGGSGGGITTADAASAGGAGNGVFAGTNSSAGSAGTSGGGAGGNASGGIAGSGLIGTGGGGGGSSITGAGGAGGSGDIYGGGGGGGGAALNGANSGAGGAGGAGIVIVISQ